MGGHGALSIMCVGDTGVALMVALMVLMVVLMVALMVLMDLERGRLPGSVPKALPLERVGRGRSSEGYVDSVYVKRTSVRLAWVLYLLTVAFRGPWRQNFWENLLGNVGNPSETLLENFENPPALKPDRNRKILGKTFGLVGFQGGEEGRVRAISKNHFKTMPEKVSFGKSAFWVEGESAISACAKGGHGQWGYESAACKN